MPDSAVVDNLVTQFSSPLHCFRELVQNSIDAGSPTVDVWTEFIESDGHEGTIALHVDDYGEGMDEAIIDEELTRLFASSKEKDLTKIGQFGIGFVSTFALEPEAILVETGRSGEYWEVLFHADKSFTKTEIDVPVEGTQITIFLEGDVHRYNELTRDIEKTLRHWCNHSDTDVIFEDRTPVDGDPPERIRINDPFEVDGDCLQRIEHEGTVIVAAYSEDPHYGFYNRGLTLALTRTGDDILGDRRAHRFAHISFKIKSRYLEHTLSRETVMRDANFEKAMKLLESAANGPLFESLAKRIQQLGGKRDWSHTDVERYHRLVGFLAREPVENLAKIDEQPLLRTLGGNLVSLERAYDTWKRDGRVLMTDAPSDLGRRLEADGVPVFFGETSNPTGFTTEFAPVKTILGRYILERHSSSLYNRLRGFLGADLEDEARGAIADPNAIYHPVVADDSPPENLAPLVDRAAELLDTIDAGYATLNTCVLSSPSSDAPLFVLSRNPASVMARPPDTIVEVDPDRRPHAAVNREHPHFRALAKLWKREPDMAAYCLAKSLLLTQNRLLDADADLMRAASDM